MVKAQLTLRNAGVLCVLTAILLYLNTLDCGFCFDDQTVILNNQDLRPSVSWTNLLWDDFWGTPMGDNKSHKSYRPLCVATFRLNYLLHELQPMGYHLVNVLLHSAVCYLYVQLCGVVFSAVWPALIAGLLFAVHPIHTEAVAGLVAGLVGRAETLSAFFFLLSLLHYQKAILHTERGIRHLCWCLLLCLFSVLSKEQGFTVIAVCVVFEFFIVHENDLRSTLNLLGCLLRHSKDQWFPPWFKPFLKRLFFLAVFAAVFLVLRLQLMKSAPMFPVTDNEGLSLDSPYRQLHWSYLSFVNSWLLLDPSVLCHDYRMGAIPLITSFSDPRNLLTVITFGSVATLGLWGIRTYHREKTGNLKRSHKVAILGISLIVFPYLPASNLFFTVGFVVAERVLYLPSMGFCMLVGYGSYCILSSKRQQLLCIAKLGLVFLLVIHSLKTLQRNRDWHSKLTLYTSLLRFYPQNGHMLGNMGRQYHLRDMDDMAEKVYKHAMEVDPNNSLAFSNYGVLLKSQNRVEEAIMVLKRAAEVMVNEPGASQEKIARIYVTIGNMVAKNRSQLLEALEFCSRGLSFYPALAQGHNSKGAILWQLQRMDEAKLEFEQAIHHDPHYAEPYYNLGLIYLFKGDKERGKQLLRETLAINKDHHKARAQLDALTQ